MTAYAHTGFRLRVFGLEHLEPEPGTVIVASHRSEQDVPVLLGAIYHRYAATAGRQGRWPWFAARDDLFLPGFLAGAPPGLPLVLRRALWPLAIGGVLEQGVRCMPVREPENMRLVELLRAAPERLLVGWLPGELYAAFAQRATRLHRPPPERARDVLDGGYADILWRMISEDTVPDSDDQWRRHLRTAVTDFKALIALVRRGEVVLIFPEGEPSDSGEIGLLRGGLTSLVRRGEPSSLLPIAIAYDPLGPGRTRAYVSVAPEFAPSSDGLRQTVRDALRRATPLTVGQLAASGFVEGLTAWEVERFARGWLERAQGDGRPVAPELLSAQRTRALERAYARAAVLGRSHVTVRRLHRELQSAHELSSVAEARP